MTGGIRDPLGIPARVLAGGLVLFLALPIAALLLSAGPDTIRAGTQHPLFAPALALSLRTSVVSLLVVVLTGTPLAWWLANRSTRFSRALLLLVDLPIVLPPAVVGVALLQTWGQRGLLGGALQGIGIAIPFSTVAVVFAQVVVSAPFFVQAATAAFRQVDPDLITVARTLGVNRSTTFLRVVLPLALPGVLAGTALCWARALGEFGATLLFAGNLPGTSQTMPVAIYTALESDVRAALALSLVLAGVAALLLLALRATPGWLQRANRETVGTP